MARRYDRMMRDIEKAALEITGEESPTGGHTSDAVFGGREQDPDEAASALLNRLEITVEEVGDA